MRKKIATVPRLVIPKKSGAKWYVYFQVDHALKDRMVPVKKYAGFNECKNDADRRSWGEREVRRYTELLRSGWSALEAGEQVIYSDNLAYEAMAERFDNQRRSVRNHHYYLSRFLGEERVRLRDNTYKTYQSKMRIYCAWLDKNGHGGADVSSIRNATIKAFFAFLSEKRGLDRLTVEKYVQILKRFYDFLRKQDKVGQNPVHDIVLPQKRADLAARPISRHDMRDILGLMQSHDPQLYLGCMFIYYLAVRPGQELRLLRIRDIDSYNGHVTIVDGQAKTKRRVIDMPRQLMALCEEFMIFRFNRDYYVFGRHGVPGPEPMGKNTMRTRFNRLRDKLELPETYKLYSMKHTGGGNLLASGATIEEIKHHFGHKSIETTDRYLRRHFGNRNERVIHDFPEPG